MANSRLSNIKEILSIIQALVTIAAIVGAGLWFIVERQATRKAGIEHETTHHRLTNDLTWVHLSITMENVGRRKLDITSGVIRVQQILPIHDELQRSIDAGSNLIEDEKYSVAWPVIREYSPQLKVSIEPGETHIKSFEFIIKSDIKVIRIYSFFSETDNGDLGWTHSTIYQITD